MIAHTKTFCSALFLASLVACGLHAAEDFEALAAESVKSYLAKYPFAAVTVGIIDAKGSHVFGFGQLQRDGTTSQPNGKTIYQIGSITKVFTTTMLAEQVVLGWMKLDDSAKILAR